MHALSQMEPTCRSEVMYITYPNVQHWRGLSSLVCDSDAMCSSSVTATTTLTFQFCLLMAQWQKAAGDLCTRTQSTNASSKVTPPPRSPVLQLTHSLPRGACLLAAASSIHQQSPGSSCSSLYQLAAP